MTKENSGVCGGVCGKDMVCKCCTCATVRFYVWAVVKILVVVILVVAAFKAGSHFGYLKGSNTEDGMYGKQMHYRGY